jgi:hypothetical protein
MITERATMLLSPMPTRYSGAAQVSVTAPFAIMISAPNFSACA